jgi:hypothetical protein
LETNFYENAKPTTFQQERLLFRFEITKILCSKYEGFSLRSASYLYLTRTAKTYAKQTSFLATDATTQSSNQEENEFFFFFFILLQNHATRKNDDKIKTKRNKRKLWLKAQIATRIRAQNAKKAVKIAPILTLA